MLTSESSNTVCIATMPSIYIARFLREGHRTTTGAPILEKHRNLKPLPGQPRLGVALDTTFIDPADIIQRRGWQTDNSRFHAILQ